MDVYKWIENNDSQMLTIGDLKKWKIGTSKEVAIFDRNFEEYKILNLPENKKYKPSYFFSANKHTITYIGDLNWIIHYPSGEDNQHRVEIDVKKYDNGWTWMPVDCDGPYLTLDSISSNGRIINVPKNKQKRIHLSKLDNSTKIGWRGPIMLWDDLRKHKDKVYYDDPT